MYVYMPPILGHIVSTTHLEDICRDVCVCVCVCDIPLTDRFSVFHTFSAITFCL